MVVLSPGYLKFVGMVDEVLHQMAASGALKPDVAPEAVRSAIMGMMSEATHGASSTAGIRAVPCSNRLSI